MSPFNFLSIWDTAISVSCPYLLMLISMSILDQLQLLDFSHYFPVALHARYSLIRWQTLWILLCWLLFCFYNILKLCYGTVKLLGNTFILSGLAFTIFFIETRTMFSLVLIIPHNWGKTILSTLPNKLWYFSSLAGKLYTNSWLCLNSGYCSLQFIGPLEGKCCPRETFGNVSGHFLLSLLGMLLVSCG